MWIPQSLNSILLEMTFCVPVYFVFIVKFRYIFQQNSNTLSSDLNSIFHSVFNLKFPNQQKNQFCPNVRYKLVAYTQLLILIHKALKLFEEYITWSIWMVLYARNLKGAIGALYWPVLTLWAGGHLTVMCGGELLKLWIWHYDHLVRSAHIIITACFTTR